MIWVILAVLVILGGAAFAVLELLGLGILAEWRDERDDF